MNLVDNEGKVIIDTTSKARDQLGENNNKLELQALKALKEKASDIIFTQGHPPSEAVFHSFKNAREI